MVYHLLVLLFPIIGSMPAKFIVPHLTIESNITAKEGSCLTVKCKMDGQTLHSSETVWLKNAKWDETKPDFVGTVVYSTHKAKPTASEYVNRTLMSTATGNCTFYLSDIQLQDTGNYVFRHYITGYFQNSPWKSNSNNFTLTVLENPCKASFEVPPLLLEGDNVLLNCSTSPNCVSHPPEWDLTSISGHQVIKVEEWFAQLNFTATSQDNGRKLSCRHEDGCAITRTLVVQYAPKQTTAEISSHDVKERDKVTLTCVSQGNPEPTYSWFKNGALVHEREELQYTSVREEHGGEYHCQAKNKHGETNSSTVSLSVKYAPKKVRILSDTPQAIQMNMPLNLTCDVGKSNPDPSSYSWSRRGQNGKTLYVQKIQLEDAGSYTCTAANSVGQTSSAPFVITVHYGPRNTRIIINCYRTNDCNEKMVKKGYSLSLTCQTEALPLPHLYHWYHKVQEESVILSEKSATLRWERVDTFNAGEYWCTAFNNIHNDTSPSLNVVVLYPPTIPNLTMNMVVTEDDLIDITCTVQSAPVSQLTLRHNARVFDSVDRSTPNQLSLRLKVLYTDAGQYTCSAKNSEGAETEQKELVVRYAPKMVTVNSNPSGELKENKSLTLHCAAQAFPTASNITWFKLENGGRHVVGSGPRLIFTHLQASDRGTYTCQAGNEVGSRESDVHTIRVQYGPKQTSVIHNMTSSRRYYKENNVMLACISDGYPPIHTYLWYKKTEQGRVQRIASTQNLTVSPEETGSYYCTASNSISSKSSESIKLLPSQNYLQVLLYILPVLIFLLLLVAFFGIRTYRLQKRGTTNPNAAGQPGYHQYCLSILGLWSGTQENLVLDGNGEEQNMQELQSVQHNSNSSTRPNVQTIYSVVKPKQGLQPKQVRGVDTETVNYSTLIFPERGNASDSNCVYAQVTKPRLQNQSQDYENVKDLKYRPSSSESSEDERDVSYSVIVNAAAPRQRRSDSSSDEDIYQTQYSQIKL